LENKEQAVMSQQAMHSDEMNHDESSSNFAYEQDAPQYEEIPRERPSYSSSREYVGDSHQQDFMPGAVGQKLSGRDIRRMFPGDQRLVLAIVSLAMLMVMGLVGIGLALTTGGSPTPTGTDVIFVHGFRHWHDFGPGFGGYPPPPMGMYQPEPVYIHHWAAPSPVLPIFVLAYLTFAFVVLAINLIYARSFQRN
jgi:hypothetical protein